MSKQTVKNTAIQKQNPVYFLDKFRELIVDCGLTKEQQNHTLKELESIGASALAISKTRDALKTLRRKIQDSENYKLEKRIKAQLKQVEKAQEIKAAKVLGVIETHNAGKVVKELGGLAGLLEGGK